MSAPPDIVDAQVHLTLELDERALLASMDALGIRSAVLDEFWYITDDFRGMPCATLPGGTFRPLSPYAQAASLRHPERFSFLQRVDRRDPEAGGVVRMLGAAPGCRAVRVLPLGREERAAFGEGGYDEILAAAQAAQLPVCVLGVDLATLPLVTRRFPDLPIVLDHCGWARSLEHWEQVLSAGALDTVFLKWSHVFRVFGATEDPLRTARQELHRAVETFGAERVMWASDLTEDEAGASWSQLLGAVTEDPELSSDDKQWLLSGTARSLFDWPTPSPPAPAPITTTGVN